MGSKHTGSYLGSDKDVEKEVSEWIENGGQAEYHSGADHQGNNFDHYHLWTEENNSDKNESIVLNIDDTETLKEDDGLYEINDNSEESGFEESETIESE